MPRGKGEGSIYKDARGLWTAEIELPSHNGKRRRRKVRSKDKRIVLAKLREFQADLARTGDLPTRPLTVEEWMNEWFTNIAAQKNRPKTLSTYRGLIRREILPAIGRKKLEKLTPLDVRRMTQAVTDKGLSSTTAMQVHRILAVALKYAEREGRVTRNVALLVDAPRKARPALKALSVEEAVKVLATAVDDPLGSLWAAVLLTGARQGELLGLEVDRVSESLDLSWQLQRLAWEHGCGGQCNRIRGTDCPKRKVTAAPDWEHRRLVGGLWMSRPKSNAGWRIIPLVEPLRSIIHRHVESTRRQPNPFGLVWRNPDGSPIDPRVENSAWHALLARAQVTDVRLHDGRHTTVDLLYEAGVPEDIIEEIVGHSVRATTRSYKARGNTKRLTEAMHQLSDLVAPVADGRKEIGA